MATTTTACPFFDKLPAEIRLEIYALTFASEDNKLVEVSLLECHPPANTLLLTCRRAYDEASKIFHAAKQEYWLTTAFTISDDGSEKKMRETMQNHLVALGDNNLNMITRVCIRGRRPGLSAWEFNLLDKRGAWSERWGEETQLSFYVFNKDDGIDFTSDQMQIEQLLSTNSSKRPMRLQIKCFMSR